MAPQLNFIAPGSIDKTLTAMSILFPRWECSLKTVLMSSGWAMSECLRRMLIMNYVVHRLAVFDNMEWCMKLPPKDM